jgi:O-succinylbenzoic acid--CoA ligase
MNLSLRDAAREAPDVPAIVLGSQSLTYATLAERVRARMDELAPDSSDSPASNDGPLPLEATADLDNLVTLYACWELGRPVVPIHPRLPQDEQVRRRAGARFLRAVGTGERAPLAFIYTSGTTAGGTTAGAIGHGRIVEISRQAFLAAADASARWLGWRPDDRWLLALPLAHVGGLSILIRCLVARRTVVVASGERFDAAQTVDLIVRERVTLCSVVPAQLDQILDRVPGRAPASLRAVLLGGAAARPALLQKAASAGWPVLTTYGLTESCGQVTTQRPGTINLGEQGSGEPLPGAEVRVVDDRIQVRTPALLTAYHPTNVPVPLTADGWLETADLGRFDAGGRLHVLGRADEVIVTAGEKVLPGDVEAALEACSGVSAACVFGVDDPRWGEVVAAAVVPSDGSLDVVSLAEELAPRLAAFQRPRFIALIEAMPLTANGKVSRKRVADAVRPELRPLGAPRDIKPD